MVGFACAVLGAGLAAGFLAGMLGAGGGLIIVPVLYHAFAGLGVDPAVRVHLVVGTALAAVVPMSLVSARAHWLCGNVSVPILQKFALPILLGSVLAGANSGSFNGRQLSLAFVLAAAAVSVNMVLSKGIVFKGIVFGNETPGPTGACLIGIGIGALSTLVGIGGATLTVPILHAMRTPMPVAVGTASAMGGLIGLPGAVAFMCGGLGDSRLPPGSIGFVNLVATAVLFFASTLTVPLGVRLTQRVNEHLLRAMFAVFLALTAARMYLASA